jgi:hypothetical protein
MAVDYAVKIRKMGLEITDWLRRSPANHGHEPETDQKFLPKNV